MAALNSRKHNLTAIFLVSIAHASSHFYHLVIPSLFPWILPAFGLNFLEGGTLMTTFFVVSAAGQSASGFMVDKIGAQKSLYIGLGLLASSAIVLGFAPSLPFLYLSAILAGAGNSVFHPTDYTLINNNVAPSYLGHAFAWHNITGNIGWAVCPFFMVTLAQFFGWRAAALSASGIAIAVFAVEFAFRKTFSEDTLLSTSGKDEGKADSTFRFLKIPAVWLCFFFFFFTAGAFGVLQSFSQVIFKNAYGLDLSGASLCLTAYLLGAGGGALLGGFATNRKDLSSDKIVAFSIAFSACMSALLASQILTSYWAVVLMALMGLGTGVAAPSRDIMIRKATVERLGKKSFGRVYGFTYCGMDVGQSLTPIVFGPLLDLKLFTLALIGVALMQTASVVTALRVGADQRSLESFKAKT